MSEIKQKTIYTAYSRTLAIVMGIASQFVLTPIILGFLGTTLYGIFVIVNKTNNFLSIVDIRPTAILRLKLAHDQLSTNIENKRKYIGASYVISLLFLPLFVIGGLILAYYTPSLFHIENEYIEDSRYAIVLLSLFMSINGFLGVPEATLRGNNLEYKGYFIEPIRILLFAGSTIILLYLGWGILSVVFAIFIGSFFSYISRLILCRYYLKEYKASKPTSFHVKYFFNKGGWYMVSSILMQIINNFDVILIGILMTPEAVTLFAITKAIVFRLVEALETLISSATSSIGEIVGSKDQLKMNQARLGIMDLVIPLSLLVASYFYMFNEPLISYWTNSSVYAGNTVNAIICLSAVFLMLTSSEEVFVLSSLNFKKKSVCLFISAIIAVITSVILNYPLGLIGNAIGILFGRMSLFFFYHRLTNQLIGERLKMGKGFLMKIFFFIIIVGVCNYIFSSIISSSFIHFISGSIVFVFLAGCYTYFFLLKVSVREQISAHILRRSNK